MLFERQIGTCNNESAHKLFFKHIALREIGHNALGAFFFYPRRDRSQLRQANADHLTLIDIRQERQAELPVLFISELFELISYIHIVLRRDTYMILTYITRFFHIQDQKLGKYA